LVERWHWLGSIWTTRRELIRGTRVRLFDELLPEVMGLWSTDVGHPSRDPSLVEAVRRTTRAGIIAGRRDRKRTSRIDVLVGERDELVVNGPWKDDGMGGRIWNGDWDALRQIDAVTEAALAELNAYLSRKIR
jgi:hypothetical protein